MIIGVDGNEANVLQKVGVSVYTFELLKYFHSQASEKVQFIVYLRSTPLDDMPKETRYFRYKTIMSKGLWRDVFFPIYLYTHREIDVLFSPAHYTPRWCPVPTIVTIHDLAYEYFPHEFLKEDLYKLKKWTRHAVNQSSNIIAVSQATADDIHKLYHIPTGKIYSIYNGFRNVTQKTSSSDTLKKYSLQPNKYFLYVGTLQSRKNITLLIEAFAHFYTKHPDIKLVIVGKKGWLYEEIFKRTAELNLDKAVLFTGYVPDSTLFLFYTQALAYILPSLYEGFGMPVVEAMSVGCPVIISTTPALKEIAGDACLSFDPHDTIALENALEDILKPKVRQNLIDKGRKRAKQFSWEKTAAQTLAIIQKSV